VFGKRLEACCLLLESLKTRLGRGISDRQIDCLVMHPLFFGYIGGKFCRCIEEEFHHVINIIVVVS